MLSGVVDLFIFFLLVGEVCDVRWVPLLCVWKMEKKMLRSEKKSVAEVNVIFYDFCHNKIMYMYVIVYLLLFVFANELLINALWRGKKKGEKKKKT